MTPNDASRAGGAPGSVAEEAALLVDLLSQRGWGAPSRMPPRTSSENGQTEDGTPGDGSGEPGAHDHPAADPTDRSSSPDGVHASRPECTCGGTTPAACRVCPVCQLIAFVQQVNPDTIERVADFVGFAATALRDLATAQRERRSEGSTEPDSDTHTHPGTHADTPTGDDAPDPPRPGGHS